jgi:hypothetical protein
LTQILISKKFEKEIFFESSVLAWIRIRIEQKCWIRIRIKSIRIHNPGFFIAEKLHYMAPNIYCAGAGTAADCDKTTQTMASQLELLR